MPSSLCGRSRSLKLGLLYVIFYWPGGALADFGDWWHRQGNRWA